MPMKLRTLALVREGWVLVRPVAMPEVAPPLADVHVPVGEGEPATAARLVLRPLPFVRGPVGPRLLAQPVPGVPYMLFHGSVFVLSLRSRTVY